MKKYYNNPIIESQGVCDPHIHIFGNKAYLYSTHDAGPGMPIYTMYDWQIFSSTDLINWQKEYVLKPEDTFLGPCSECYATDAAERSGKYYFYFSDQQRCTGVAVSENGPAGPFRDALGKPLLPAWFVDTACYDPTVFIDDDENRTPYIMFGYTVDNKKYYIARLNEDMISLAESPKSIVIDNSWKNDACWITKKNGLYYLNSHGSCYATSNHIYGPYTYRGIFCNDAYVDHGTFFTFHNQTYFAYGVPENWGEERVDAFYRTTKIIYAHYRRNGEIVIDPFIEKVGVAQYDAQWGQIRAEWYFAASSGLIKDENETGFEIRNIFDGTSLFYPRVDNIKDNTELVFRIWSDNKDGAKIDVKEYGVLLVSCTVPNTNEEYLEVKCGLTVSAGTHDMTLEFRGGDGELMRLDWFMFI